MNTKWKWVFGIISVPTFLLLLLSLWTLFLPHGGYRMMSFGMMFPAWLIMFALLVFVLIVFDIIKEG